MDARRVVTEDAESMAIAQESSDGSSDVSNATRRKGQLEANYDLGGLTNCADPQTRQKKDGRRP